MEMSGLLVCAVVCPLFRATFDQGILVRWLSRLVNSAERMIA